MKASAVVVSLLACFPAGAYAGGQSIFKLGNQVDHQQKDVLLMYMMVMVVSIAMEALVHYCHHSVTSESGRNVLHHVTEEVMILGGISALLVLFENLGGARTWNVDTTLLHYVHFVIFAMAIFFITLVSALFVTIERSWRRYTDFESRILQIEGNLTIAEDERRRHLQLYIRSVPEGNAMWAAICFFRNDVTSQFTHVTFSRYMMKKQRNLLLYFLDLTGATWFALGVLVGFQALLTHYVRQYTENDLALISGWVLFVGLLPLLLLVIVVFKIRYEFRVFVVMVEECRRKGTVQPEWLQRKHFWLGSHEYLELFIQILLLFQVFYLATVTVNFVYRLMAVKGGVFLLVLCYAPSVVVFGLMLPLVMPPLTILGSLGEFLCLDTIISLAASGKSSGRERRQRVRDRACAAPPQYLMHGVVGTLHTADCAPGTPLASLEEKAGSFNGQARSCEECGTGAVVMLCSQCGPLCAGCDSEYHRLRMASHHDRVAVAAAAPAPAAAPGAGGMGGRKPSSPQRGGRKKAKRAARQSLDTAATTPTASQQGSEPASPDRRTLSPPSSFSSNPLGGRRTQRHSRGNPTTDESV
eukprot:Rhum_TRINITY_DN4867_c0_g2::Rhum_TRINITY_DN4867_c0_g2_i1::g.15923::m.15923